MVGFVAAVGVVAAVTISASNAAVVVPSFDPGAAKAVYTVPLDGSQQQLVTTDLNGDGHPDILIAMCKDSCIRPIPITILVNDGKGNFSNRRVHCSRMTCPCPRTRDRLWSLISTAMDGLTCS